MTQLSTWLPPGKPEHAGVINITQCGAWSLYQGNVRSLERGYWRRTFVWLFLDAPATFIYRTAHSQAVQAGLCRW